MEGMHDVADVQVGRDVSTSRRQVANEPIILVENSLRTTFDRLLRKQIHSELDLRHGESILHSPASCWLCQLRTSRALT